MAGRGFNPPRAERVAPLPLAGGGASANRLDLDPSNFRDKTVQDRKGKNTLTVAEALANTLGGLDTTTNKQGKTKAPLVQFTESLRQAFLEHQKAPEEGNLTAYQQAFSKLFYDNPAKAAEVIAVGGFDPELASAVAKDGFLRLYDEDPTKAIQAVEGAGLSQEVKRALVGAQADDAPPAATPEVSPLSPEALGLRGTATVDLDEITPFQPSSSPVPWGKFHKDDIIPITDAGPVYDPDDPNAGPMPTAANVWLKKQADRGWRTVAYPPIAGPDGSPGVPRRVLEVLASKLPELMPTDPVRAQFNPNFGKERVIFQPAPQQKILTGLTAGVQDSGVPLADKIASLTPEQRQAMMRAQDLQSALQTGRQITSQQQIAPNQVEGMMQVPLAEEARDFDATAQGAALANEVARIERRYPILQGLVANNPATAPAPVGPGAPINRGDYPLSLAQLLGDAERAEGYYLRDQVRPSRQMFPLMRQAHVIRALADITGNDFFPALPPESSTVGKLNKQFEEKPVSEPLKSRVEFDEESKSKKGRTGSTVYEIPDEKKPITEGSVGPFYDYGVASVGNKKNNWATSDDPRLAEALAIIERELIRNPKFDPNNPDAINPNTGRPFTEFVVPRAIEKDILALLTQEGVPQGGRIIMRHGTAASASPRLERMIRAEDRGALTKLREQTIRTIEGESPGIPDVVAGLLDPKKIRDKRTRRVGARGWETYDDPVSSMDPDARTAAAEVLQRAIDKGGILNMPTLAPWASARFVMDGPDGQSFYFRLRPEHVARIMAQTMLIDNPGTVQSMVPMVARSMEVYDMIPASGRALDFMDESGSPQYIRPTPQFLKALYELNQTEGVPLPDMFPMEDVPQADVAPGTTDVSAMMPRFRQDQFQASPLATLIG